jgi:hypothetical protein
MKTKDAIYEFITKEENIYLSEEIFTYYSQLRDEMHGRFWNTFNRQMEGKLANSEFSGTWGFGKYPIKKIKADGASSSFFEKQEFKSSLRLFFGQQSQETGYHTLWGIRWLPTKPTNINPPDYLKLQTILVSKNIRRDESWAFWGSGPCKIFDPDFIRRMYLEPEVFVNGIVEEVWGLYLEVRPVIEAITRDINKLN